MDPTYFGAEQVTDEDRAYHGSRFSEVRDAIFANPYQKVWGGPGEPPLPVYDVTLPSVLRGALPFGPPYFFRQAVARAVDSKADLRWGVDHKGFRRIIHPNGICLTGLWEISDQTPYSGYFRTGSRALLVGRYSTCCKETRRGGKRSLSLVGKLFPTANPDHREPLRTANFITQQDLGGERTDYINDAELRNAPNTTSWRGGFGVPILLVESILFGQTDKQPTQRQLYQIAELDKLDGDSTHAPAFMRLLVDPAQPRIPGDALDFRDEIMAQIYDRGDPASKRSLTFHIEVTDEGSTHGPAFFRRRKFGNWARLGDWCLMKQSPLTMAISSFTSITRHGGMIATIPPPRRASMNKRYDESIAAARPGGATKTADPVHRRSASMCQCQEPGRRCSSWVSDRSSKPAKSAARPVKSQ